MQYNIETKHQITVQKQRAVCKFYRQGRCTREPCPYRHPESLAVKSQQQQHTPTCTRGQGFRFLTSNSCQFFHPGVGVQMPRTDLSLQSSRQGRFNQPPARGQQEAGPVEPAASQGAEGDPGGGNYQKRCHFQQRCSNQNCSFSHEEVGMERDFLENF